MPDSMSQTEKSEGNFIRSTVKVFALNIIAEGVGAYLLLRFGDFRPAFVAEVRGFYHF
jgi:hypothetical protein